MIYNPSSAFTNLSHTTSHLRIYYPELLQLYLVVLSLSFALQLPQPDSP